ncbi:fimbria/pilus outer membrane usher protein [Yersinia enterocolitica]
MKFQSTEFTLFPTLVGVVFLAGTSTAESRDYFDPGLLSLTGGQAVAIDLSAFETAGQIPPGSYLVSMFVNQMHLGQHQLMFKATPQGKVEPELTPAFLNEMGVNTQALPSFIGLPPDIAINSLSALIPQSQIHFDFAQQRLELSIPQIAMQPNIQGAVDPALWDQGIPALLFNYSANGGRNWQEGQNDGGNRIQTNLFASARGGVNWQAWRLRSDMTYTYNENRGGNKTPGQSTQQTQFSNLYLQRDIAPLRSEVLLGESNTENDVFDSIPFRGVKFNSSDDMLPSSLRGFAPLISGIAQSNARVTISQNGNVIYQTFVAPGPFRINDLFPTGQGGDLTVTITETDGTVRTQTLALSSLPVMRRPGSLKYELTSGRYNGGITVDSKQSDFALGTLIYGLPYDITLYGGGLIAQDYASAVAGSGLSLGSFGALSADITTSSAKLAGYNDRLKGNSYRIRYAKSLLDTGTSVDLAAYRYSTRDYYSFSSFNSQGYQLNEGEVPWSLEKQRSNLQVRVNQQLGAWGSTFLSVQRNNFWGSDKVMNTLSAGYNGNHRGVNYGVAYSIDRTKGDGNWPENRQLSLNMQVPLNVFSHSPSNRTYASYQMTHNNQGMVQQQAGITGSALDDRLSYSALQGWANGNSDDTSTLNAGYQGSKGMANIGYSYSPQSRSLNMGGNGALIVHQGGVTLSQMLGSSVALVRAPGAGDVGVMNGSVRTDSRGYAVVPYLSNYQNNSISLNPSTLPDDVDITQSTLNVYPTKGAVVMANFATRIGYQALVTLQQGSTPIPFGALVTVDNSNDSATNTGIVGDNGQVYLSGLAEKGSFKVKWGNDTEQQCQVVFNLSNMEAPSANNPIRTLTAHCEQA